MQAIVGAAQATCGSPCTSELLFPSEGFVVINRPSLCSEVKKEFRKLDLDLLRSGKVNDAEHDTAGLGLELQIFRRRPDILRERCCR